MFKCTASGFAAIDQKPICEKRIMSVCKRTVSAKSKPIFCSNVEHQPENIMMRKKKKKNKEKNRREDNQLKHLFNIDGTISSVRVRQRWCEQSINDWQTSISPLNEQTARHTHTHSLAPSCIFNRIQTICPRDFLPKRLLYNNDLCVWCAMSVCCFINPPHQNNSNIDDSIYTQNTYTLLLAITTPSTLLRDLNTQHHHTAM